MEKFWTMTGIIDISEKEERLKKRWREEEMSSVLNETFEQSFPTIVTEL